VRKAIRRRHPRVQDVAAALLRMDPAARQPFIRPFIDLVMRVTAVTGSPPLAPCTPANWDLYVDARTLTTAPDEIEFGTSVITLWPLGCGPG
jgi:hypothetical protein